MQVLKLFGWLVLLLGTSLFRGGRGVFRGMLWLGVRSRHHSRNSRRSGSHGTARFATTWEIFRAGALFGSGPLLGKGRLGRLLRFSTDGIVMVFAATGAGKGLGIVIPTLLTYRGSMFVTDPKGENFAITARRRSKFGKVYMLSPTDLAHSQRFNPLTWMVRKGTPFEADDATVLARYMHRPDAREAHWDDRAVSLLTCFLLHALHGPTELQTLARVRTLSVGGAATLKATLEDIAATSPSLKAAEIASGFLTTMGRGERQDDSEFRSILSTLQKATEVWSAGANGGVISTHSTFSLDELVTQNATLYLCVDEDYLETYERWLRVMTGCMFSAVLRAKRTPGRRRKLVMLLDEVAALGPLDVLEKNAGLLRAYCTPVLIWQNLLQAFAVYGQERGAALLANASARVFFGTNDNATADYVSAMLGNATILSASQGVSQSSDAWLKHNLQNNKSEGGYWLLDSAEVQGLPPHWLLIRLRNCRFPILTKRLNYRWRLRWWFAYDRWVPGANASASTHQAAPASASTAAPAAVPATAPATTELPVAAAIPPHVRRPSRQAPATRQ